jgi:hypothetical protein
MTIPRVWGLGQPSMLISPIGTPMLTYADAASLDANVQRTLDKSYVGGTMSGLMTLNAGGISLDSSGVIYNVQTATTTSGGRLQWDFPIFSTNTVVRSTSLAEMFVPAMADLTGVPWPIAISSNNQFIWFSNGSVGAPWCGTYNTLYPNGMAVVPLTRMHDGASILSFSMEFIVNAGRSFMPVRFPGFNVLQYDPFFNKLTSISNGWNYLTPPANAPAYIAANPNVVTASTITFPTGQNAVDVSKYLYFAAILDEDYYLDAGNFVPNLFTNFTTSSVATSFRFQ